MDFDAAKIREEYSGLWRIEESFRIMKSDLLARPVHVNTKEHNRAYFLICPTELVWFKTSHLKKKRVWLHNFT